jgi:hypothetical protein
MLSFVLYTQIKAPLAVQFRTKPRTPFVICRAVLVAIRLKLVLAYVSLTHPGVTSISQVHQSIMLKQGTIFTKSQFSLTIILLTKAQQFKIKITNKVNNFMPQLFIAPPYQPCHILHGKSVVTYRHSALLHLAELFHSFFHGSQKNYTHHWYHFKTKWLGKDILYKGRNDKTCTMSGFIGAALQRI